ncbi:MAG TPA: YggS family pyridoxal phosphate-dependent enzyme [Chloroflexota bacterium]|nr:YggS family pyridoxal phosphate-dependent enzyme [Chloroflexota bacterium]
MCSLGQRLEDVHRRIADAAERAGRSPEDIQLVAVSKTVPAETVMEAYRLGQRHFGENRVQEFREKRDALAELGPMPDAVWHMIGHLQRNKAKPCVELFDIIQSVDSVKLAGLLNADAGVAGKRLRILLEVDFSDESQRSGFSPVELERVAGELVLLPHVEIQGLMTVAPLGLDQEGTRTVFRRLRQLRDRLATCYPAVSWRHLSMGMSDDYVLAIEEGATIVRVGRAIFGERSRG